MEYYLKITTEVNGEKVIAHRRVFIEYPKKETLRCLEYEARTIASKITGINKTKIEFAKHYLFDHEEYNPEKHDGLDCVDLTELYEPIFYAPEERIDVKDAQRRINYLLNDWRANIKHYNTVALDIVKRFPKTKVRD